MGNSGLKSGKLRDSAKGGKTLPWLLAVALIISGFFSLTTAMAAPVPPKPSSISYVYDYANLLEPGDVRQIKQIAKIIDDRTRAQLVVVTVKDLGGKSLEEYSLALFRSWGIGDKEKNNGVLLLVNEKNLLENRSGRIRIEVGYGLEGAINDGKAGAILDHYALPAFEKRDYSRGIAQTFMAISSEVAKEYDLHLEGDLANLQDYEINGDDGIPGSAILALIVFIIIVILLSGGGRGRRPRRYIGPFSGFPRGFGGFYGGFGGPRGGSFGGGFRGGGFRGGSGGGGGASR